MGRGPLCPERQILVPEDFLMSGAPRAKVRECLPPEWLGLVICHTDPERIVYSQALGRNSLVS